ncbi:MAG TPA: carboxymuconolactone decarboxylase family protein [Patescibacteria group bacterium]|nr:carboxymuconolactone decarboxylase family protein [Patescibacteria group bacterium]
MTSFKIHTAENAPEQSRPLLKELVARLGFLPNVYAAVSESPMALRAWLGLKTTVETGLFTPVERRIVMMTTSYMNDCSYCVAAGSAQGDKEGVAMEIIEALRADKPLKDAKHEQLRQFTRSVLKRMGRPEQADIDAMLKAGYTNAHILEVVSIISLGVMGNYINHIIKAPLDAQFEAHRFGERKADFRKDVAA